ncbi:MAG: hypothetical protein ACTHN5_20605 [Phycisphaerae bacterium]
MGLPPLGPEQHESGCSPLMIVLTVVVFGVVVMLGWAMYTALHVH